MKNLNITPAMAITETVLRRRKARPVDTTLLEVIASANTREVLYAFDTFLTNRLIANRSYGDESYRALNIWQTGDDEWNMTFDARVTNESYNELVAYAEAHGICVYGYVSGEGWSAWQLIVDRPAFETAAE